MGLTKKLLKKITVGSFIATIVIKIVAVISILGIYNCQTANCSALHTANIEVAIGGILLYLTTAIFTLSLIMLIIYYILRKP
jgi:hypothetical protein